MSSLLKHPKQLGLCLFWKVGNFAEENCSSVGQLKTSLLVSVCTRESTFYVPEELALKYTFG